MRVNIIDGSIGPSKPKPALAGGLDSFRSATTPAPHAPQAERNELRLTPLVELGPAQSPDWLWPGYIVRGGVTLLTGLWKAGKTTLLGHLLRDMPLGRGLIDVAVQEPVIVASEEGPGVWAQRRDALGLGASILLVQRESFVRSTHAQWLAMVGDLAKAITRKKAALVVFDTLPSLWPVQNENDASEVVEALAPLRALNSAGAAVLLVHHPRKGEGDQAQASRGSGALPGFVDIIVELRRYNPQDNTDTRRKLTAYGRYEGVPPEVVVDLTPEGYQMIGRPAAARVEDLNQTIEGLLPAQPPGLTADEIAHQWPGGPAPARTQLRATLNKGSDDQRWERYGKGVRSDPFTYVRMA